MRIDAAFCATGDDIVGESIRRSTRSQWTRRQLASPDPSWAGVFRSMRPWPRVGGRAGRRFRGMNVGGGIARPSKALIRKSIYARRAVEIGPDRGQSSWAGRVIREKARSNVAGSAEATRPGTKASRVDPEPRCHALNRGTGKSPFELAPDFRQTGGHWRSAREFQL